MKSLIVLVTLLASSVASAPVKEERNQIRHRLYSSKESHLRYMWAEWMRSFNKQYSSPAIAEQRFAYFVANLKLADERNQQEIDKGGNAVHGITKFFDQDAEEFRKYFLGSKSGKAPTDANTTALTEMRKVAPPTGKPVEDGAFVNWAGVLTTPVKDQGYCGSCWAFSATEQIESDSMRTLKTDFILSPEQITQCAPIAQGCGGGWTEVAYGYVKKAGGIETDAAYPYTSYLGVTGECHVEKSQEVVTVNSFTTVSGETDMANYVLSTGPLSVCLDANNWSTYTGGIMTVCGQQVDHCVQAVGVDTSSTGGYWIVRNSWGTSWGEDGYIYLAYGQNTCDITNDPTWTTVALVN